MVTQGHAQAYRVEIVRAVLLSFIAEQRWGFGPGVVGDEGAQQAAGVLNFDAVDADHWAEQALTMRIAADIESGTWRPIYEYMRSIEFFGGVPPGSIRRLPEGTPRR